MPAENRPAALNLFPCDGQIKGKGDMETFWVGSAPFTLADPVLLKSQSFIGSKWRAI